MISRYQFSSSFCICRRRVLQVESISGIDASSSTAAPAAAAASSPFSPTDKSDSTMAIIIVIFVTALFFMGLFTFYVRRLANAAEPESPQPTPSRRKGGGLDPSAVGSLPLVAYGSAESHRAVDDCPICLSEFEERETVKLIPYCGHVFHARCIDTWLSSHVTCPVCRSSQLFKSSGDEAAAAAEGLFGDEYDAAAHV